ncbi:MAG: uridine kinase [Erysipelothrix sp.]|nr:uridine kinase [Erysipelothrix sp.]
MKDVVIIGIAGGSASGKTLIGKQLKKAFSNVSSFQIIKMDDYYKDQKEMSMEERYAVNYDHPFAFDIDLLVKQLKVLKNRQAIEKPLYDYVTYTRKDVTETINPSDVIILDGLFCLEDENIREILDMKIFVDTPADVRFIRRLMRDVKERGRTLESVVNQYMNTVRVMHDLFVEPSKRHADIIVPEGGKNRVAIDLLKTKISSILNEDVL